MKKIFVSEAASRIGQTVFIAGWAQNRRNHGKIIFIDLRDRTGVMQVVFTPKNSALYEQAQRLRNEWVIGVSGTMAERPKGMQNRELAAGSVELQAQELVIYTEAQTPPFAIDSDGRDVSEDLRMKYRYLDLRRERMKNNLVMRHKVEMFMRQWLTERGFTEIETPILTKSTPEGARDYVVPSRLYPGKFFALPQSPQQYKQLLMVAGLERYFQVVRCFRDEDPRGDRQPEFTQLDIEMSFADRDDILDLIEELYLSLIKTLYPKKNLSLTPEGRIPRISYQETMEKYQSDKPDIRQDRNNPDELAFLFMVDFPMFEWKEQEKRWDAVHHPFTMPAVSGVEDFWTQFKKDPRAIKAYQYDFVLNGYEIGGGSIRIHEPKLLEAVFEAMGNKPEEIRAKFGHMLEAFSYGVPPHGGIAPGIDRLLMILQNEPNIREVMAFPKTGDARDLMMDAPSTLDKSQLQELSLQVKDKKD